MAPTLCAVVFDLDGLMFNTEELYVAVGTEMLRRRGKAFTKELIDQMMGRPSRIALQLMIDWHGLDATVDQLQNETEEIFGELLDTRLETMPGLLQLLDSLEAADIPKAIGTSSRRSFVENVLSRFDLEPRFDFILTSEDVQKGKPAPEIYLTAARRFEVSPFEAMVLEDSGIGCRAAVAAGAFAVAVPGGHSHTHEFDGVQFIATSLKDPRIYSSLGMTP